jgi:acyl carrier protein
MRNFLKSLFGRGDDPHSAASEPELPASKPAVEPSAEVPEFSAVNSAKRVEPAGSVSDILTELVAQVRETMPDPRPPEEIDVELHMYDAGYVTSISAADLLAFIDQRYGLDIAETKLIGPLQNLAALAAHIESQGP